VNLPNYLTLGRICLVPLVVGFLISAESIHALVAAFLFGAAALTDWLDGLIARRRRQVTVLGKLLDPVADKLLVSAALVSLVQVGQVEAWIVVVIIGREFAITGLRGSSSATCRSASRRSTRTCRAGCCGPRSPSPSCPASTTSCGSSAAATSTRS
jgi:CDP-diacylglycerol--glycerol-3-phosphate 3-phosphatidyltransferase